MDLELCQKTDFCDTVDTSVAFVTAFVMKRSGQIGDDDLDRKVITNIPHLVAHHSPDGYEFGYGGSGPADLALNVCQLYLNHVHYTGQKTKCYDGTCWTLAWALHQDFKREFIADASWRGEIISFARIEAWFEKEMTTEMVDQYADVSEYEPED